jgi:holo-[acyl-carrier protein] synthase
MPILGIGVDIVHVPRIAAVISRRGVRFAERVLNKAEHEDWAGFSTNGSEAQARFIAVR